MAKLAVHRPANGKVLGSILSQRMYLGLHFGPQLGKSMKVNQSMFLSHIDVSLPLFIPSSLPLSLKSINVSSGEHKK